MYDVQIVIFFSFSDLKEKKKAGANKKEAAMQFFLNFFSNEIIQNL